MPSFVGGYVEPGVYVRNQDQAIPSVAAGGRIGAITGTGKANKTIKQEKLLLSGSPLTGTLANPPLVSLAIDPSTGNEYVVDTIGEKFFKTTDFTYVPSTGVITWVTPNTHVPYLNTIIVTYDVAKTTTDKEPKLWTSLASVIEFYGDADEDGDGVIENSLSLGAQIYFENGGNQLWCCQVATDDLAGHEAAITKLGAVDAYCIVPLLEINTTNAALMAYLKNHCDNMSTVTERKERIGILGGEVSADDKDDTDGSMSAYASKIDAIDAARIIYPVPSGALKSVTGIYTGYTAQYIVPGPYIAAAIGGIICNNNYTAGEPISGKDLSGLDDINDYYTRVQKNKMAAVGGFIIDKVTDGVFRIRHALSTSTASPITQEVKITRIKDSVARLVRTGLESMFINTRFFGNETIASVSSSTRLLLDQVINLRDIVAYQNITAAQNGSEPRQIDVSFQIRPTWDVNWILVTFGVTI